MQGVGGTHGPQEHRAVASERESRERMACVDPVDTSKERCTGNGQNSGLAEWAQPCHGCRSPVIRL